MDETKTIKVFCSVQQAETDQTLDVDGNGEVVLTCTANVGTEEEPVACGRFIKYPKGTTAETLKAGIAEHKFVNEGQLSVDEIEKEKTELIDAILEDQEQSQL